jgi:segregation and condensation protein B
VTAVTEQLEGEEPQTPPVAEDETPPAAEDETPPAAEDETPPAAEDEAPPADYTELSRALEALLFLSAEPATVQALAAATATEPDEVVGALRQLAADLTEGNRGIVLRELAGGWALSTHPDAEDAARALFAKPRTPPLTPAQAETLAIVAYLQPVSRPEIARIRGVNAESAAQALLERGIIEESGRSQFGAVLYRTSDLFLKLFGLQTIDELPDVTEFDPSPELEEELRERLLRAGEARAGGGTPAPQS